jgi:hypothetical protein
MQEMAKLEKQMTTATITAEKAAASTQKEYETQVETLDTTIEGLKVELTAAQSTAAGSAEDVARLKSETTALQTIVEQLESTKTALTTEVEIKSSAAMQLVNSNTTAVSELQEELGASMKRAAEIEAAAAEQLAMAEQAKCESAVEAEATTNTLTTQIKDLETALAAKTEDNKVALQQIGQELTLDSQRQLKQYEDKLKDSDERIEHWKAEFYRATAEAATAAAEASASAESASAENIAATERRENALRESALREAVLRKAAQREVEAQVADDADGYNYEAEVAQPKKTPKPTLKVFHPRSSDVMSPEPGTKRIRNDIELDDPGLSPINRHASMSPPARPISRKSTAVTPSGRRLSTKKSFVRTPKQPLTPRLNVPSSARSTGSSNRRPLKHKSMNAVEVPTHSVRSLA